MKNLGSMQVLVALEPILCCVLLTLLFFKKYWKNFRVLTVYLTVRLVAWLVLAALMHSSAMSPRTGYKVYFYCYWVSFAIESIVSLGVVYDLYRLAMAPLPGLQRLGMLMFRWAAGIAVIVAVGIAVGPHLSNQRFIVKSVLQLQQTESIITLCLLLFVTFAVRPMGLSFRSRIFGVSLGLGFLATSDLVASAWLSRVANMDSAINVLTGVIFVCATVIWTAYFLIPEPRRQLIVLPTTSPFLRWNQIALALGDSPGFVAVGGIDPAFLAPAEVEIMERASIKMGALALKS